MNKPGSEIYLSDISKSDKPWDKHRADADKLRNKYKGTLFDRLSERISTCSGFLGFGVISDPETGEGRLKLQTARFCRVRHCPVCQWRRSLMWFARMIKAIPIILNDHPKTRFISLTLTVRNCPITELRSTIQDMNQAWKRMTLRKQFPAIGFAKSIEVTRAKDGLAHPHFHCLLAVENSYFKGSTYLSHSKWVVLWKESLRVNYDPSITVKTVTENSKKITESDAALDPKVGGIQGAICETFKYSVKRDDLLGLDQDWLVELTSQLHKTRAVSLGGLFKEYLSEEEPEDLIGESDENEPIEYDVVFGWREWVSRYAKVDN